MKDGYVCDVPVRCDVRSLCVCVCIFMKGRRHVSQNVFHVMAVAQ